MRCRLKTRRSENDSTFDESDLEDFTFNIYALLFKTSFVWYITNVVTRLPNTAKQDKYMNNLAILIQYSKCVMSYLVTTVCIVAWRCHKMETFSALLAICAGKSPVTGDFPAQRPVTPRFDVFFDLRLNKRLSKQSWDWSFETQSHPLWRHRNDIGWL